MMTALMYSQITPCVGNDFNERFSGVHTSMSAYASAVVGPSKTLVHWFVGSSGSPIRPKIGGGLDLNHQVREKGRGTTG